MDIFIMEQFNVFGEPLTLCCSDPLTGFTRTGYCETLESDHGLHTVCAQMTQEFLAFSKSQGNDLSTPRPELGFKGLKPGDSWCLCANRWLEAYQNGSAPKIKLKSTHLKALEIIDLDSLKEHSIDIS